VLAVLHEPEFVDLAPGQVYAQLLDAERYLCSERTMYRILEENHEVRERRDQLRHPAYAPPELLASAPNQVWSWDITKLLGPAKWTYFYLYVILDLFSRYVVGWMVAHHESAALAKKLIAETCRRQGIAPGELTLHADRGPSMTSKPVALLLADLGVTKTHSRPYVSNDNPFSEAQFKTMKYRPNFPDRFGSIQHARGHGHVFFPWYNTEQRHSGLAMLTPFEVHYGLAEKRLEARARVLAAAFAAHPERFVAGLPRPSGAPNRGLDQQAEGGAGQAQSRFPARGRHRAARKGDTSHFAAPGNWTSPLFFTGHSHPASCALALRRGSHGAGLNATIRASSRVEGIRAMRLSGSVGDFHSLLETFFPFRCRSRRRRSSSVGFSMPASLASCLRKFRQFFSDTRCTIDLIAAFASSIVESTASVLPRSTPFCRAISKTI
jgi:putative transposase